MWVCLWERSDVGGQVEGRGRQMKGNRYRTATLAVYVIAGLLFVHYGVCGIFLVRDVLEMLGSYIRSFFPTVRWFDCELLAFL